MRGHIDRFFAFVLERHAVSDMCPKEISLNDFESYQSKLRDRGLKNSSNNRNFNTIKTFFARLLKERKIDFDFAKLVESLKVDEVQREAWDLKDTPILVSKLIEKDADPVLIDIVKSNEFTPFGPTDYKRVKWKDYDFNIGEIQTFRMKGKGKRVWNVPITLGYQKLLLQIRKRQESIGLGKPNDYVYLTRDKKPLNPTWVSKSLERARKEAGILNVPYTSRHRILTEVSEKLGVDTASKFAGHASVRTTEKHYLVGGSENFRKKVKEVLR